MKKRLAHFMIVCFILISGINNQVSAQVFQFSGTIKKDAINFKSIKNLIIIPVYINEKGPFNFILDTGADPMIILDSSIIDQSYLKGLRSVQINGYGDGDEITGYLSNNIAADVGHAHISHLPTIILKEDVFNLSTHLGIKIHGLLGFYFFNSFTVRVNYALSKISFYAPGNSKKPRGQKLKIDIINHKPYILSELNVPGLGNINARLIVDCGASHALSLEALNGTEFPIPSPNFEANLGVGLNGKINGRVSRINSLKLGSFDFKNILTNFPDFKDLAAKINQKERTGNLGANVLKKFTVTYDYRSEAMYLKKNSYFKESFEHDMSGIEIYVDNEQFQRVFVGRVESDSPADKAGILPNDEIISINFKDIEDYVIDDITSLFKSESGKVIIIELVRNDKIMVKLLKLKKRL